MKKNVFFAFVAAFVLFGFTGCDHETDEFDGPDLVDRFGAFEVLTPFAASADSVDFPADGALTFTGEFNKSVNWVIRITGNESGAVQIIEGFSEKINAQNAAWSGGTTQLPLFKAETATVSVSVPEELGYGDTLSVEVLAPKAYSGSLLTDFEAAPGANIVFGNFEFELTNESGRINDGTAAQGDFYYNFRGTDGVVTNFFVGLINILPGIAGQTYVPLPTTNPENVYFNCFIKHDLSPHTIAVIQFAFDTNNNGVYNDGTDQTFQVAGDFPLFHDGWRHFHHPMSETGMTSAQLEKIVAVRVLLISDNNSQPSPPLEVGFGIDFITFTQGGPLVL